MKRIFLLIPLLALTIFTSNAQTPVDVVTGLNNPLGILFIEDELYIAEAQAFRINKLDVTSPNSDLIEVVNGLDTPTSFALKGDDLYIIENNLSTNKISKIDLTESTPEITEVLAFGLDDPIDVLFVDNTLYICQFLGNKISKIDITDPTPSPVDVVTGLNLPNSMVLKGDYIYITEFGSNKISKIDITDPNPVLMDVITGVSGPFGMAFNGDDLYISQPLEDKISKVDLTSSALEVEDVADGLGVPSFIRFYGNDLYISEISTGKISKIENLILSTPEIEQSRIRLYPNPSSDFIQISNLESEGTYRIFNSLGAEVKSGIVSYNAQIDIRDFAHGLYFFEYDNQSTVKFVKE
jgi:DNA-binding beta-propeller fold protein YncE